MANLAAPVVNARIVYWGVPGSGKTTNLKHIHGKLRPDHRGDLKRVPTAEDPGVHYEVMPIELGEISGVRTRLQVIASPGSPDLAATRKKLLDQVDGIVFVLDARRERVSENLAALEELRKLLRAYGRGLDEVPVVLQYNHRDQADALSVEELHRKIGLQAAAFEAVAPRGMGVLESLTTISKRVVRNRREAAGLSQPPGALSQPPSPAPEPLAKARPGRPLEPAIPSVDAESTQPGEEHTQPEGLRPAESASQAIDTAARRAERAFEENWEHATGGFEARTRPLPPLELQVLEAGPARVEGGRRVRLPLRVVDADGREGELLVTLELPEPD